MRPVRFVSTGYALAVPGSVVVFAWVVVVPDDRFATVPHVNEMEASALPLPVRCPFSVAVVGCTLVAAVVVAAGVPHGVPAAASLSTPFLDDVTARITTWYSVPFVRPVIEMGLVVAAGLRAVNVAPPSVEYS